jgi:hypothetical protein
VKQKSRLQAMKDDIPLDQEPQPALKRGRLRISAACFKCKGVSVTNQPKMSVLHGTPDPTCPMEP